MACTYGLLIVGVILYFIIAITFLLSMTVASIAGSIFYGGTGLGMLDGIFGSDTVNDLFALATVPGSWWLQNFREAWDNLQDESYNYSS
jgi:hypothetical protein